MHAGIAATFRLALVALILALAGGVALPVAGYMAGKRLIGPYEGRLGLRDYVDSIYGALGRGEPLAWLVVLAPLLIVLTWWTVIRLGRRAGRRAAQDSPS